MQVFDEVLGAVSVPDMRGQTSMAISTGDERGLFVTIEEKAVKEEYKSKKAGRAVYRNAIFFNIHVPGGDVMTHELKENREDLKQRFPKAWANFLAQKKSAIEGTPVEECPLFDKAQIATLKANNVYSVDQFTALPEGNAESFGMGFKNLHQQAKGWLNKDDQAKVTAEALAAKEELEKKLAMAMKKIDELSERVDVVEVAAPNRSRRKSKVEE